MTERTAPPSETAHAVVTEQVAAFNAHDLERFLATYAQDTVVVGVTPEPIVGKDALRAFYGPRLAGGDVHCTIDASVAYGERWVVAREIVTTSNGSGETVATFEVLDGVITRASMLKA
ncbi:MULTISPECIES: nuclear transport factor 2 family protein [Oerskovia]|jgi:hypothetical protein|uniref:Nuclear transport factor 2 family protein n=1 Tax=Oerskovia merdavium TaxID=2762227 RepID=A0ABR8U0S7_9CELL|nr:nuclear transport factor 2 family protein [Oerskovia merdavium]MBD7981642.1 nuclear transport factor 2 family protein [Oerskovia merdavium]